MNPPVVQSPWLASGHIVGDGGGLDEGASAMRMSAKVDYAVRALLMLADAPGLVRIDALVTGQQLPAKFLETILADLRRADMVRAQRGLHGGYALARLASQVTLGEVFRAVEGPLAEIHGQAPGALSYPGVAVHLPAVWVAIRASLRDVLDEISLADVLKGRFPAHVQQLISSEAAWLPAPDSRSAEVTGGTSRRAKAG